MTVLCMLFWGRVSKSDEHQEWGLLHYRKLVTLPFMPREGDVFSVMKCSPVKVSEVEFDVEAGRADILLDMWNRLPHETWEGVNAKFVDDGWTFVDNDGAAPSFQPRWKWANMVESEYFSRRSKS